MSDDDQAMSLLKTSTRKSFRLSVIIPIVFFITGFSSILGAVFLSSTGEEAERNLIIGLSIGFSIILIFYLINWFFCLSFLREIKHLEIKDSKLQKLINLSRYCCILFMIPLTFFIGLVGFYKVNQFAEGKVQRGSLDQILYNFLIEKR
ncbi:hypothetical protein BTS2_1986 [Bacillus sp. TS-2]|nr:hypothetical protein BTS2_1986 [Bacillus sp. TS-2]